MQVMCWGDDMHWRSDTQTTKIIEVRNMEIWNTEYSTAGPRHIYFHLGSDLHRRMDSIGALWTCQEIHAHKRCLLVFRQQQLASVVNRILE